MLPKVFCRTTPFFLLCAVLIAQFLIAGCDSASAPAVKTKPPVSKTGKVTVQLEVDFQSDRENIVVRIPCSEDSTVLTILARAQNIGDLEFTSIGEGETAFVTSIGGVENQAAAGDNWVYRVNDELGDKSCGVFSVKPGDEVLWVFGEYP